MKKWHVVLAKKQRRGKPAPQKSYFTVEAATHAAAIEVAVNRFLDFVHPSRWMNLKLEVWEARLLD